MSVEVFSVEYDGKALESGLMDVRDLAPALLALGTLCQEANSVVNGSKANVSLEVRADFKRGSFDVHLQLVLTGLEHFRTMLMGQPKDAKEILEVIGFYTSVGAGAIKGLLAFRKALAGQQITDRTSLGDGTTRIVVEHQHTLTVDNKTLELFERQEAARALEAVAQPLYKAGVDVFQVRRGGIIESTIAKDDLSSIYSHPKTRAEEPGSLSDTTVVKVYEVITASKTPEYIWRLSDGQSTITVHILDDDFFRDIQNDRLTVSLGDYLRVGIRSVTTNENGKLKTAHTVARVLQHIPRQTSNDSPPELPLRNPDEPL